MSTYFGTTPAESLTPLPPYNNEKLHSAPNTADELSADREGHNDACDLDDLLASLESDDEEEIPKEEELTVAGAPHTVRDSLLNTNPNTGLTNDDVGTRRRRFGSNQMREEKHNYVKQFLSFFVGPIPFAMVAACALAGALRDWIDFGVIIGLLLLNACIGFAQDFQAGNVVKELKKGLALKSRVKRNGTTFEVDSSMLVPGDIVHLDEGTIVPADGFVVSANAYLQVDQSGITGESLAVEKHTSDTIYQSSTVKRGESLMMVTAIGDSTYVGRSAALVNAAAASKGHFTEVLGSIGLTLLTIVICALVVVWIAGFYQSDSTPELLNFTLGVVIAGVPVGLPAVVTTTMAVGAAFLAKKRAIVQRLSAIESLAGVEILCTDKTGTLTKNKLSLGQPYVVDGIDPSELMLVACLAASRKKRGLDAIDKAFLKALKQYPNTKDMLSTFQILEFRPFDPVSKKVTAIVQSPSGERMTCVKGAPATIMHMVREQNSLPEEVERDCEETVTEFAHRGFRSLGIARRRGNSPWELMGIMPCLDPPRHDTAKTIKEAMDLGLKIKMLTGDAVGIAKETSRQLGLGQNVYNSERLGLNFGGNMPGSSVFDFVVAADGFAEVFPQHKYNAVDILQKRGYLVAMTGDGVNDAPSLKKADTGIAVQGSSDAARSAADIVFLAPGLSAIIDAIKTSRQIFHRMYADAIFNTSLTSQHICFLAIFADIATLAVAYDNAPFSLTPVKWNLPRLWVIAVLLGLILFAATVVCQMSMKSSQGIIEGTGLPNSVIFLEIVLTENWLIFITRAGDRPFWRSRPSWQLITAVLLVDLVATAFCLFGWLDASGPRKIHTTPQTIARVWIFSFCIFCIMAGVYYLLTNAPCFDRSKRGKLSFQKRRERKRNERRFFEDFAFSLRRTSGMHDLSSHRPSEPA